MIWQELTYTTFQLLNDDGSTTDYSICRNPITGVYTGSKAGYGWGISSLTIAPVKAALEAHAMGVK